MPSKFATSGMDVPDILFYYDSDEDIEYLEPQNYDELTELIKARDPRTIAISRNGSDEIKKALGSKYRSRTVNS